MVSNQSDGSRPRISASLPTNHKQALDYIATERSQPGNRAYTADIVREAIEDWLHRNPEELPPEARDLLDDDLLANAGGDEFGEEADA